jgi:transglutaminase-like putative cysteine protease
MWAAVFSSHALAFRAGSPLLALLPPMALLAFADTVLQGLIKPQYGVAFLAAALLIVFADALRRVQGWGPVWVSPGSRGRLTATASRGARRVAIATVATAAFVPLLVPGFGSKAIIDLSSSTSQDRVRIDPLVSVGAMLSQSDPVEVFQVSSNVPSYWRLLALPNFDGNAWRSDTSVQGVPVTSTTSLASLPAGATTIDQTFQVSSNLGFPWLPMAYPPERIDVPNASVRYDAQTGTATIDGTLDKGAVYHVTSIVEQPTPAQLDAEVFPATAQLQDRRYVQLPPGISPQIRTLAQRWTAGATTVYAKVLAIQNHLSDPGSFRYSTNVPRRDDSNALLDFLTVTKEGFCQQFASAMAVMLRELGIPSRVAMGFTPGAYDPATHTRHVTTKDAHSWVEVLFPDYGWLPFEPTPGRLNPIGFSYQHPSTPCPANASGCFTSGSGIGPQASGSTAGASSRLPQQLQNLINRRTVQAGSRLGRLAGNGTVVAHAGRRVPIGPTALMLLAVAMAAAVVIPPARSLRRRLRLHRAGSAPRALILATYDVFGERAADLGHPRRRGETLEEYRSRMHASGALSSGHIDRLTTIAGRAAYAAQDPVVVDLQQAQVAAETAFRELRKGTALRRRIAGMYRLRS